MWWCISQQVDAAFGGLNVNLVGQQVGGHAVLKLRPGPQHVLRN